MSQDLEESSVPSAIQDEARTISYLVDSLAQMYDTVRNSKDTGNLSFIVRPIEHLIKFIHYNTRIIVNTVTEYNYTYHELVYFLVEPSTNVEGITESGLLQDDVPTKIVKFGFPIAESGNVLSYTGLAHEISHFIYAVKNLDNAYQVEYSPDDYKAIEILVSDSVRKAQKSLMEEIERSQLEEEITSIVYSWIKEIICDCLAVCIMGPAFLFTVFQALSLRGSIYHSKASPNKKYYPPPVVRFRNVLQCLSRLDPFRWTLFEFASEHPEAGKQFDEIQSVVQAHINHIDSLSDTRKLRLDPKHELALALTNRALKKLHASLFFENNTQKIAFPLENFRKQMMRLYWRLLRNIPINEVREGSASREVPDFRVILNVGWVRHLVMQRQFPKYNCSEDAKAYKILELENRLLRKSLELAEFDNLFHG